MKVGASSVRAARMPFGWHSVLAALLGCRRTALSVVMRKGRTVRQRQLKRRLLQLSSPKVAKPEISSLNLTSSNSAACHTMSVGHRCHCQYCCF